jgi:NADPH:quinone reductase-like Zn-dependent oxidoreductase
MFVSWILLTGLVHALFARAAGATVTTITSSEEKVELLKSLGAKHVINYKTNPNWGQVAKELS